MGMFDHVRFRMECPRCKKEITGFQTKNGPCILYKLDYWETENFYASCDNCRTWVEFTLKKRPNRKLKISDYKMEVKKTTKKDDEKYRKDMDKLFGKLKKGGKEA